MTAANGEKVDALVVFSLSIKFMKDEAVKIIRASTGDESHSAKDIQWVLTVPAIWRPAAKQFMREAAYEVSCNLKWSSFKLVSDQTLSFAMSHGHEKQLLPRSMIQNPMLFFLFLRFSAKSLSVCPTSSSLWGPH